MESAETHYFNLLDGGATPQEARSVLPNSTKTEITITANYREWRNFFKLRTAKAAHPQMREVTIPLLKELKEKLPIIFAQCCEHWAIKPKLFCANGFCSGTSSMAVVYRCTDLYIAVTCAPCLSVNFNSNGFSHSDLPPLFHIFCA